MFEKTRFLLAGALIVACFALSGGVAVAQTPMVNGQNHSGTIATVGQIDTWTFTAVPGDTLALRIGEVGADTPFSPSIRLLAPNGSPLGSQSGALAAQITATATLTGTYQVLVTSAFANIGSYVLTLVKIPGTFVVPPGDDGGPMTAGLNHSGVIARGDLDPWTFTANKDDSIVLNIGEPLIGEVDPGFYPSIRLFGPDGALLGSQSGARVAQINETAPLSGTYTVLVTSAFVNAEDGHYLLTLVKAPGGFAVPDGDQGGPMTPGLNHPGRIVLGDLDPWNFTANRNDAIVLNIGEPIVSEVDPGFYPWIRVFGPDGEQLGSQSGARAAQINVTAPLTGTYTVVVTSAFANIADGHYLLTLVKVPGTFEVPPGDDGGPIAAGANHPGVIAIGDLDPWTFTANRNDAIVLNIGEPIVSEVDPGFYPWIRVFGPDGAQLGSQSGVRAAQINLTAPLTGTYTVVVTSAFVNVDDGHYLLTLVKVPGAFVVPPDDEGGPMTRSAPDRGAIAIGDLDPWTFTAATGNPIALTIGETMIGEVDPGFYPWIRLFGPDGMQLGSQSGALSAQINVTAPLSGTYTVVVTSAFVNTEVGHYMLTLSGVPVAPVIVTQPQSQTISSGQPATLSVVATGTAPLSYQWYVGPSGNTASPITGATASTYTTPPLTTTTSYWVRVSNAAGSVNSATATITVAPAPPVFTIQASNLFLAVGSSGSFTVLAVSTPPPTYRWQMSSNGGSTWTNLSDGGPYSGTGTPTLTVSGATPALNGLQFRCVASNGTVSTNSAAAILTVVQAIRGLVDLNSDGGGDVFLYNRATGARRFEVTTPDGFAETSSAWDPGWQVYPANLNADGYTDFFLYDPARGFWIQALNHAGDGTFTYTLGNWDSSWTVVPSDLDGDGLTDMFVYNFANGVWVKCFTDGSGGFKGYAVGNWDPGWTFYTADLNGDTRDDFFLYNRTNGVWVEAFSQAGFGTFDYPASGQWDPDWQVIRGDLNRDGRTDLFLLNASGVHVSALSRAGGGFDYVGGPDWSPGWSVAPGDLNGDAATDLFHYDKTTGLWVEELSDGAGGFTLAASGAWDPGWTVAITDFNADARADVLLSRADGTWVKATHTGTGSFTFASGNWGTGWTVSVRNPSDQK